MSITLNRTTIAITGLAVLGGLVTYAAYFDYKRRNDSAFRKKLRSQKKRIEQHVSQRRQEEASQNGMPSNLAREKLLEIYEKAKQEPVPTDFDEKQRFFHVMIDAAERFVAQGPQTFIEAAKCFFQALRAYPMPVELIVIYQKTVPEPILAIVMELYNIDVLGRIRGYYDNFPPKSMNVLIKKTSQSDNIKGQARTYCLVAAKDFRASDVIYKEKPVISVLDADVQTLGTHCAHCLRKIDSDADHVVKPKSDRLRSVFCSEECQKQHNIQSQDMLFNESNPLPVELLAQMPPTDKEARARAQKALADHWETTGSSGLLLVARLVAMQIIAELAKAIPHATEMKRQMPDVCISGEYTVYDHLERLRYVDVPIPEDEHRKLKDVLMATMPFLDDAHSDERHAIFRGKMAYNTIGVVFEGGRDNDIVKEDAVRTRTPYGTAKQVGSGLYLVSSYIGHSCNPSVLPAFSAGTSEIHLVAARDIRAGEELTMAYVDVAQHEDETRGEAHIRRRSELAHGWKFSCACETCGEEKGALSLDDEEILADQSKVESSIQTASSM